LAMTSSTVKQRTRVNPVGQHADISNMPRQAQVGLLAVAALAAIAIAGDRIVHAVHDKPTERNFQIPVMGSTPAAEAATLEAVRVPSGFRPFQPCTDGACFVMSRSLALNTSTAHHLAEAFGVKIASDHVKSPPVECGLLVGRICKAEGLIGREYVEVSVQRPEVRNPKPLTRRNRKTYEPFMVVPGTEVEVSVIGHCLHAKECAEMAREEIAEADRGK
jgi:hypothetical protein